MINEHSTRDEVLAAVRLSGLELINASSALQKDKEVVLAAINQNYYAYLHASATLQTDNEVLLATIRKNSEAIVWVTLSAEIVHYQKTNNLSIEQTLIELIYGDIVE